MIKIKNINVYNLDNAIVSSGYPLRFEKPGKDTVVLDNELERAKKLASTKAGTGHDNFLKGILVVFDLKYSLYFTKQLQRYHFIDFVSSQSTMHTIIKRKDILPFVNKYVDKRIISIINEYTQQYNSEKSKEVRYDLFMKIISNLPSGFELWASITTNYLQLKTIYFQRKNHKLKEDWGEFIKMIENLPYFKRLVIEK